MSAVPANRPRKMAPDGPQRPHGQLERFVQFRCVDLQRLALVHLEPQPRLLRRASQAAAHARAGEQDVQVRGFGTRPLARQAAHLGAAAKSDQAALDRRGHAFGLGVAPPKQIVEPGWFVGKRGCAMATVQRASELLGTELREHRVSAAWTSRCQIQLMDGALPHPGELKDARMEPLGDARRAEANHGARQPVQVPGEEFLEREGAQGVTAGAGPRSAGSLTRNAREEMPRRGARHLLTPGIRARQCSSECPPLQAVEKSELVGAQPGALALAPVRLRPHPDARS